VVGSAGGGEPPVEADAPPARAVVAGHGDFATGVISAVAQITGRGEVFLPMTNRGLSADDITRQMREHLDATGAHVVFTDLPAGSCTIAARRLMRERPGMVLVTGANLATLLDFVFHGELAVAEAAQHAAARGREALVCVPGGGGTGAGAASGR
jgi:mannose/fructose-specific phosphotransferase system component IIA